MSLILWIPFNHPSALLSVCTQDWEFVSLSSHLLSLPLPFFLIIWKLCCGETDSWCSQLIKTWATSVYKIKSYLFDRHGFSYECVFIFLWTTFLRSKKLLQTAMPSWAYVKLYAGINQELLSKIQVLSNCVHCSIKAVDGCSSAEVGENSKIQTCLESLRHRTKFWCVPFVDLTVDIKLGNVPV